MGKSEANFQPPWYVEPYEGESISHYLGRYYSKIQLIEPVHWFKWVFEDPVVKSIIDSDNNIIISRDSNNNKWTTLINYLLHIVKNGKEDSRNWAILKLHIMSLTGILNPDEKQSFAEALWDNIDTKTCLPKFHILSKFTILRLPEPQSGMAKDRVKKYLLSYNWSLESISIQSLQQWNNLPELFREDREKFLHFLNLILMEIIFPEVKKISNESQIKLIDLIDTIKSINQTFILAKHNQHIPNILKAWQEQSLKDFSSS